MTHRIPFLLLSAFALVSSFAPLHAAPAKAKAGPVAASDAIPDERRRKWWMPRHEAIIARNAAEKPDIILVGDSITHWWGGLPADGSKNTGAAVFDYYFGDRKVTNLGYASDRTYHVIWRLKNGELDGISPKVAVVMIGTNNHPTPGHTPEDTAGAVKDICALIRKSSPNTKILLLAVFPRDNQKKADYIAFPGLVNKHLAKLDGKDGITYLDLSDKLGNPDGTTRAGLFYDRIHPTAEGYKVWGEAMEPTLAKLLGTQPKPPMPDAPKKGK